jgi:hypothetical protein
MTTLDMWNRLRCDCGRLTSQPEVTPAASIREGLFYGMCVIAPNQLAGTCEAIPGL